MEINRHHLWFEKREYRRNSILHKLRTHRGFIIPTELGDHRALHRSMDPTPKPGYDNAEALLEHVGPWDGQTDRLHFLDAAIDFLQDTQPLTARHLVAQRGFLLLHPLTIVEHELITQQRDLAHAS